MISYKNWNKEEQTVTDILFTGAAESDLLEIEYDIHVHL